MNEIVDRLWLKTREHIGDLLDRAEQSIGTMQGLVQRAETAADNAERGAPEGGWPAEDLGPHEHTQVQVIGLSTTLAGKADLVSGHVPTSQIPALALTKPSVVQDRAGMLALVAQEGDVAVIQGGDEQGTYMLGDGPSGVYESWVSLASSVDVPVQSVNGQVGTVVLGAADVGAAPASHGHPATNISDATTVGRAVLTATNAAAARTAVGAGTSSLALGTTSSTAARGNHTHSQYAESSRVTALEDSQPIIVSSLPSTPLSGRIYLVMG